jgi:(p)ppGpp synthase/HD superfamily hydrolase
MQKIKSGKAGKRKIGKRDSWRIEKAIHFLSDKYRESGFNEKPVVLHSLRIAFDLMSSGVEADVVIIAILHDLMEDSVTGYDEIEDMFGEVIARGVMSLTENKKLNDYKERYEENFKRIVEAGEDMVAIKLADLYDNSFYIHLLKDRRKQKLVIDKIGYFLDLVKGMEHSKSYKLLEEKYVEELKRLSDI